jgi:hypothetical protein
VILVSVLVVDVLLLVLIYLLLQIKLETFDSLLDVIDALLAFFFRGVRVFIDDYFLVLLGRRSLLG